MTQPSTDLKSTYSPDRTGEVSRSLVGTMLAGRYHISKKIAEGGMGTVYQAEHMLIHKLVAVKVLHGEMSQDAEMVVRFQREAQAAAAIDHPNICAATDFGRTSYGEFFMVMEYLDGRGLDQLMTSLEPLGPQRTVHIAQQICAVLEQAHRLGIIHRDLKPENIMILSLESDSDYVKVMDFGVARIQFAGETSVRLTKAGVVYGTPAYMSPEQVTGEDIDARADLYSLGVMMYEMLTGHIPFNGSTVPKVMTQHLNQLPTPPRVRAPQAVIPEAIEAIVLKLLAKKPQDRFQSAAELRHVLLALDAEPDLSKWRAHPEDPDDPEPNAPHDASPLDPLAPDPLADPDGDASPHRPDLASAQGTPDAGLTPTLAERARALSGAQRAGLIAVLALLITAIGLSAALLSRPRPTSTGAAASGHTGSTRAIAQTREQLLLDAGLSGVLEAMARGEHAQAVQTLSARRAEFEHDPHFHYYLGVAHSGAKEHAKALLAYKLAILAEPHYAQDKSINEDVVSMLGLKDEDAVAKAEAFIRDTLKAQAKDALIAAASDDRNRATRRRAMTLLQDLDLFAPLPPWQQLHIELKNAVGCTQHRDIIQRMVALKDPRVIPSLQEIDKFPRRGCGKNQRQDCFSCVRDEVREGLLTLQPLKTP